MSWQASERGLESARFLFFSRDAEAFPQRRTARLFDPREIVKSERISTTV